LVGVRCTGVPAVRSVRLVVGVAASGTVAGVALLAVLPIFRPAGCPCSLEAVVVTHASLALVLVRALGTGVAAVRSVRLVVGVAGSGTVAGVRVRSEERRVGTAGSPCRLGADVVTQASLALVLVSAREID